MARYYERRAQSGAGLILTEGTIIHPSGDGWVKQTMSMEEYKEEFQQAEVQDNLNGYLDNATKYEQVGTEKIGGVDAVKVKGVIPADALSEVINASGMMNEESTGLTGELLESLFKDMDDMEVYFWFNPETLYPVKYEMDMIVSSVYYNQIGRRNIVNNSLVIAILGVKPIFYHIA